MEGKKIRAIGTSLILCLAAMNISGCGSKDSESSANAVMGRVTSVSDTQIVMEVMDKQWMTKAGSDKWRSRRN